MSLSRFFRESPGYSSLMMATATGAEGELRCKFTSVRVTVNRRIVSFLYLSNLKVPGKTISAARSSPPFSSSGECVWCAIGANAPLLFDVSRRKSPRLRQVRHWFANAPETCCVQDTTDTLGAIHAEAVSAGNVLHLVRDWADGGACFRAVGP